MNGIAVIISRPLVTPVHLDLSGHGASAQHTEFSWLTPEAAVSKLLRIMVH